MQNKACKGVLSIISMLMQCDEALPSCGNCARRGVECRYHKERNTVSTFNVMDMELMHFYASESYIALQIEGSFPHALWRDQVPRIAFKNPVLMHALLCFSASHLLHISGEAKYDEAMRFHKHHALSLMRTQLDSKVDEAVYGTGVILALQSIGTFNSFGGYPTDLDWVGLVTGFRSLVAEMWDGRHQSIFYPLIEAYQPLEVNEDGLRKFNLLRIQSQLPPRYSEHVKALGTLLASIFPGDYYDSPRDIRTTERSMMPDGRAVRYLLAWIATVPESFVSRAKECDSAVLMLLLWVFAVFRQVYRDKPLWWLERIAKQGIEDIQKVMSS